MNRKMMPNKIFQGNLNKQDLLKHQCNLIEHLPLIQDRVRGYAATGIKALVLIRGCPGSGKTSRAKSILESINVETPSQNFFSSDNFFSKENIVTPSSLDEARRLNELLVFKAMKEQVTPVIVDDCLLKKYSLKNFYDYAVKFGYLVEIVEPTDPSSLNPDILIQRTHIPVTYDMLKKFSNEYEFIISAHHLLKYFKMQYRPEMIPPQKVNLCQKNLNDSEENSSDSDSTSKPPSPVQERTPDNKQSFNFRRFQGYPKNNPLFSSQTSIDERRTTGNFENEPTTVTIPKGTILQLQNIFGGYLAAGMLDDKNDITLPYGLARQVHSYIMESVEEIMFQKERSLESDIEADQLVRQKAKRGLKGSLDFSNFMEEQLDKFSSAMKNGTPTSKVTAKMPLKLLYENFPDADSELISQIVESINECLRNAALLISTLPDTEMIQSMEACEISKENRKDPVHQALSYENVSEAFYEEINVYSEKAKTAFAEGHRSLANFYYELGKWHKKRIEKVNISAAKVLLKDKVKSDTLDLHFLNANDGIHIMDLFLDANIRLLKNSGDNSRFLFIITGSGVRTKYGNVLKYSAKRRFAARNIQYWQMNPGMFKVCVKSTSLLSCDLEAVL